MRRSSRIQIKHNTSAPKCDPIFTENKKTPLQAIEYQKQLITAGTSRSGHRILKRRDLKKFRKPIESKRRTVRNSVETKEDSGKENTEFKDTESFTDKIIVNDPNQAITVSEERSAADASVAPHPLLTQEESKDSILSDVSNSIKIDRTIKNLSPKKFFINKNGKTTRSGRNFSPYDFATYSLLFGSFCAGNEAKKERRDVRPVKNPQNQVKKLTQNRKSRGKRRFRENQEQNRSKKGQSRRSRKYRRRNQGYIIPSELPIEPTNMLRSPLAAIKIENSDFEEDYLYSEEVPAAFLFDFPPTPVSELEGHSLPPDFYSRPDEPMAAEDAEALSPMCLPPFRKLDRTEMDALSKISLSDADKYEFKTVFKDVQAQVANFESCSGHEVPGWDVHKFDLMESESAEGRRFYRKRITDSRLIAWHKYNLMSSTRYLNDADPPAHARPIIKVRSNLCQRADLVWRLNQTLPPPSIEDVLDLSIEESRRIPVPNPNIK